MYVNRLERKELDITKICFTLYNFDQYVSYILVCKLSKFWAANIFDNF